MILLEKSLPEINIRYTLNVHCCPIILSLYMIPIDSNKLSLLKQAAFDIPMRVVKKNGVTVGYAILYGSLRELKEAIPDLTLEMLSDFAWWYFGLTSEEFTNEVIESW